MFLLQIGQEAESKHMDTTNKIENLDTLLTEISNLEDTLTADANKLNSMLQ